MTRPIQLATSTEIYSAQATLAARIEEAKASSILTNAKIAWYELQWNFTDLTERTSPADTKPIATIAPLGSKERYEDAWADLLCMLIVWLLEEKHEIGEKWKSGTLVDLIKGARRLIDYLIAEGSAADITEASPVVVESYLTGLMEDANTGAIYTAKGIIARLVARGVAPQFSSINVKGSRKKKNGPSNVQASSWNEIVALGCAYQRLRSNESPDAKRNDFDYLRYYTMLASLLVCAPSRISELWRTAADIVVLTNPLEQLGDSIPEDSAQDLDFKLGLVWHPVKGGRPIVKPIPLAMQEVARDCIDILYEYGKEAREIARWIMDNPGSMPIAEEVAHLRICRDTGIISSEELKDLFGLPDDKHISTHKQWWTNFPLTMATRRQSGRGGESKRENHYCFRTLEAEWWHLFQEKWKNTFGADWPYAVNSETYKLEADRALLIIFEGQIDPRFNYRNKLFLVTPTDKNIHKLLVKNSSQETLFERLDICLPDGSCPSIQTHDLRHFLNTMAQRAGIPEPIIAMWSGRRSIAQNSVYDHRTDAERLRAHGYHVSDYDEAQVDDLLTRQVGQAFQGNIALPSIEILSDLEASVRDLNRRLMISITQFGFCVGDLKSEPCPHAMNCLSCARLVVCKGAAKAKTLFEDKIRKLKNQRDLLRSHVEGGGKRIKNDKVLPHLEAQIAGAEDMLMALNDPHIEDGTIIARKNKRGAIKAGFTDRIRLFATEQGEIPELKGPIKNG
ncbi:hypothetical protein SAMN04488012_10576 [Palleronia salina]|uniref:Integrase n=1 Tax=Palleronia salina TaxID=313368 RepID=A0A1M6GSZ4_9RHOB|nr:hypothetical protein [Palleronia salina]SHJ13075.1 hypothetical protein SAMN04488012_10576 [Palleronia salina]